MFFSFYSGSSQVCLSVHHPAPHLQHSGLSQYFKLEHLNPYLSYVALRERVETSTSTSRNISGVDWHIDNILIGVKTLMKNIFVKLEFRAIESWKIRKIIKLEVFFLKSRKFSDKTIDCTRRAIKYKCEGKLETIFF